MGVSAVIFLVGVPRSRVGSFACCGGCWGVLSVCLFCEPFKKVFFAQHVKEWLVSFPNFTGRDSGVVCVAVRKVVAVCFWDFLDDFCVFKAFKEVGVFDAQLFLERAVMFLHVFGPEFSFGRKPHFFLGRADGLFECGHRVHFSRGQFINVSVNKVREVQFINLLIGAGRILLYG